MLTSTLKQELVLCPDNSLTQLFNYDVLLKKESSFTSNLLVNSKGSLPLDISKNILENDTLMSYL